MSRPLLDWNSLTTTLRIFASPELVSNASISIVGTERNVTLVGMKMCWSDALFYCRDFYWDLLSIRSPEEQEVLNGLLASASYPLTSRLWVGLRRYLLSFLQTHKFVVSIISLSILSLCFSNLVTNSRDCPRRWRLSTRLRGVLSRLIRSLFINIIIPVLP